MPHRKLTLPLRGFGPGAQTAVDQALAGIAGVVARANEATFQLHIEYDDTRVTSDAIHDALARAGIGHAPHGSPSAADSPPDRSGSATGGDHDTGNEPSVG